MTSHNSPCCVPISLFYTVVLQKPSGNQSKIRGIGADVNHTPRTGPTMTYLCALRADVRCSLFAGAPEKQHLPCSTWHEKLPKALQKFGISATDTDLHGNMTNINIKIESTKKNNTELRRKCCLTTHNLGVIRWKLFSSANSYVEWPPKNLQYPHMKTQHEQIQHVLIHQIPGKSRWKSAPWLETAPGS